MTIRVAVSATATAKRARYPAAPLREILDRRRLPGESWRAFAGRQGVCDKSLWRLLAAEDLSGPGADHWAIRFALHPAIVWPDRWGR